LSSPLHFVLRNPPEPTSIRQKAKKDGSTNPLSLLGKSWVPRCRQSVRADFCSMFN